MSTPMRRRRSPCCARAASGHDAAPARSVMNLRGWKHYRLRLEATLAGKWLELLSEIAPGLKRDNHVQSRHVPRIDFYAVI
jgi:hypothetical protein